MFCKFKSGLFSKTGRKEKPSLLVLILNALSAGGDNS